MKTMPLYDLGEVLLTDECKQVDIKEFFKKTDKEIKRIILNSEFEVNGLKIKLTKSCTGYGGERFWWLCPHCERRCGILYLHPVRKITACRSCLDLKYRSSAKKGMIERNLG